MEIPNYVPNPESKSSEQENYNQQLNLTLQQNLGQLGFAVTTITNADLTATPILNPNTGALTTVADLALVGSVWFITDAAPPNWVGKQAENPTVLVQFTTAPYP